MNSMSDIKSLDAIESIATVGDLELWDATIDVGELTLAAEKMMTAMPELPAIVVLKHGKLIALMTRRTLFSQLSRPLGRDIYLKRPITEILVHLDRAPVVLPHDMPIASGVELVLSRSASVAYEPVLVSTPGNPHRVLAIDLLLRVQSSLLDQAMQAKDNLLAEVQRTAVELRTTLDQFNRARDRLVQSEKMVALGQLVAGVAHEINTPIGVALTAATHLGERTQAFNQLVANGQLKRSDLQSYTALAQQSTELLHFNLQRAAQLIQSFKQVAVDQASEQRRNFDLNDYLEQLITSLRPEARKLGHNILLTCPEAIAMSSYPGALAQVISNLIANAMVHAYPEGSSGTIRVIGHDLGEMVSLAVEDDGAGIPEEHRNRIYDPFFTTRRGSGGSGLGLNIVFNIVHETLHGEIACHSTLGHGTTFTITLPRVVTQ